MTTKQRFTTAIATGAVLLNAIAPVAFADSVTIGGTDNNTGNGAYSNNTVHLNNSSNVTVNQSNNANVTNNVSSNASTGGNKANFNTGGDTTITTGNATTNVSVINALNLNKAAVDNCNCEGGATNVTISKNGDHSDNSVDLGSKKSSSNINVTQTNNANVENNIDANAKTGGNNANHNTDGNVTINTGAATTNVSVSTLTNANVATIGGGTGSGDGSSVTISKNGAFSDNSVNLNDHHSVTLKQNNDADIDNNVDADASTGGNNAKFNTGGDTTITTHAAKATADVNNLVNFNAAEIDCGCLVGGVDVTIAKNGDFSDNYVDSNGKNKLAVDAFNVADLDNNVDADAKTGYNKANDNVGDPGGDPGIDSGPANSSTDVSNTGNVNTYGTGEGLTLPGDIDLGLSFDLGGLWAFFHHLSV